MQISRNKNAVQDKDIFRKIGLKATIPRLRVYEVLKNTKQPLGAEQIFKKMKVNADRSSVYRTLNSLVSHGILTEVNLNEGFIRYELKELRKHHHHIKCVKCGKIECIDICIQEKVEKLTKYKISNHSIEFSGTCPECS